MRTIGRRGGEPGEFNFPTNVFVDKEGHLFVADTLNFRIQSFNPDASLLNVFGTLGDTPGSLNRPKGVGVDGEGHVYVADSSFNNFQIFDQTGQLLLFVGSVGSGPGEFLLPAGLFIDGKSRIYVVDQGNARVQVFQYLRVQDRTAGPAPGSPPAGHLSDCRDCNQRTTVVMAAMRSDRPEHASAVACILIATTPYNRGRDAHARSRHLIPLSERPTPTASGDAGVQLGGQQNLGGFECEGH